MTLDTPTFVHNYRPGDIHFGRGCVSNLGDVLEAQGVARALVVTGTNVGANSAVMDPITEGAGDRLAGVFDETTPEKSVETALDGVEVMRDYDADALIAVGAGSSMDVARTMNILYGDYRTLDEVQDEVQETGNIAVPAVEDMATLVCVPTTLAGADLTMACGTVIPLGDGEHTEAIPFNSNLMAQELFYDPNLYETTPMGALAGSAFNGLDKPIEMLYSKFHAPITDGTAVRSLKYLREAYPKLADSDDPAVMDKAVTGYILAQFGWTTLPELKLNIIHAFGHGLRNQWGIQQGIAHAVIAPHVLRLLFDLTDGRRDLLAEGLVQDPDPDDSAEAVIEALKEMRDGFDLPTRLRDLDGTDEAGIRSAAEIAAHDELMALGPDEFDPSVDNLEEVIRNAW